MINISKYFSSDSTDRNQTLKPVIIITEPSDDSILFTLTLNQENLLDTDGNRIKQINSLNKVSNVKISNDYDSKRLKINRLRFSLYNYYDVATKLSEYINRDLINKNVYLFYKSPTTKVINFTSEVGDYDCLLIYRGEISRLKFDDKSISITAEDKTQIKIADKQVPYMDIERLPSYIKDNMHTDDKTDDATMPMTFGKVDKAHVLKSIDPVNGRIVNMFFDFMPTSDNFKTSKIPFFLDESATTPTGNFYYLYVKSGSDYVIIDHYDKTENFQEGKYSKIELFLSGGGEIGNIIFPQLVKDSEEIFSIYDMEGFSQRTVQASYASDGSVINLASMQYEDLDNDEMVNLEKISDNNGFDKKWYRRTDPIETSSSNFDTGLKTWNFQDAGSTGGEGRFIVLQLEKGVDNNLLNITTESGQTGNTFIASDYRVYQSEDGTIPNDNNTSLGYTSEGITGTGFFVAPISVSVWKDLIPFLQAHEFPGSTPESKLVKRFQAICNAILAETDEFIDNAFDNPESTEALNTYAPFGSFSGEGDFFANAHMFLPRDVASIGDSKYWGVVGSQDTLNDAPQINWKPIQGHYYGIKDLASNFSELSGITADEHKSILIFEYFPPLWNPFGNFYDRDFIQGLKMNNLAVVHSVLIEDVREQEIFASIEGRFNNLFTEELDQDLYQIGDITEEPQSDIPITTFTQNSQGGYPDFNVLIEAIDNVFRGILNTPHSQGGLLTEPNTQISGGTYAALNLVNADTGGYTQELTSFANGDDTQDWKEVPMVLDDYDGYHTIEYVGTTATFGQVIWNDTYNASDDPISHSYLDAFIDGGISEDLISTLWTELQAQNLDDSIMFTSYTLFRNFIYPILCVPLRLYRSWNTLYDSIGHNHNLKYIFTKKFSLRMIYEYIYQTDIDIGNSEDYVIKHFHRFAQAHTGPPDFNPTPRFIREINHNIETRMNQLREYTWDSEELGDTSTLDGWLEGFNLYMNDYVTAFNTCLKELEAEIDADIGNSEYSAMLHYDNNLDNDIEIWQGRINFNTWVQSNPWFYGVEYLQGNSLSSLRAELINTAGITEEEEEETPPPQTTYTDGVIRKPSDIVMNILTSEMEFGKHTPADGTELVIGQDVLKPDYNQFDIESIQKSRAAHDNWQMGFSINKKTNGKKLIEDILKESKSYPNFKRDGKFGLVTIKDSYTPEDVDKIIVLDDIMKYNFSQTKREDVGVSLRANYRYDQGQNRYGMYLEKDISELLPDYLTTASQEYDLELTDSNKEINLKYHTETPTVYKFMDYTLLNNCNVHNICEMTLTLNNMNLSVGDIIHIPLINNEKIFDMDYSVPTQKNSQFIYPFWIIMETDIGTDGIKIKAVQLHHLTQDQPQLDQGEDLGLNLQFDIEGNMNQFHTHYTFTNGSPVPNWNYNPDANIDSGIQIPYFDVTGNGTIDVADIIAITNYVLGTGTLTLAQKDRLKYNSTGSISEDVIDVVDVIALVNIILHNELL